MKTFTLTLCFIGVAALLAGLSGPAADAETLTKAPMTSVDGTDAPDFTVPTEPDAAERATCMMCSSSSTGACSGAKQCRGSRKECRKKGCKITGTSSCSSSANVKKC